MQVDYATIVGDKIVAQVTYSELPTWSRIAVKYRWWDYGELGRDCRRCVQPGSVGECEGVRIVRCRSCNGQVEEMWVSHAFSVESEVSLLSTQLKSMSTSRKVITTIDEMVTLLKAEQSEDDSWKTCCIKSFDETDDETSDLATQMRSSTARIRCQTQMFVLKP